MQDFYFQVNVREKEEGWGWRWRERVRKSPPWSFVYLVFVLCICFLLTISYTIVMMLTTMGRKGWKHVFFCSLPYLFDEIPKTNLSDLFGLLSQRNYRSHGSGKAFTTIISELAKDGHFHEALKSFARINNYGVKPTNSTICTLLKSCTKVLDWHLGSQIHARIIRIGYDENLFLNSSLIDLYAKCGKMDDAKMVFDSMKEHDHVSWTCIVGGCAQNGYGREAMLLFKEMLGSDVSPNCFTFASVISVCTLFEAALEQCALLHAHVIKMGIDSNSYVVSSLIDCYSKCGKLNQAITLFYATVGKDAILFNSMIVAYSHNLPGEEALNCFIEMRNNGLCPTEYTLSIILNVCGSLTILQQGMQIHCLAIKMGSEKFVFVACSLVDMYSKCGHVDQARCIFDQQVNRNDVLWTSMITGYAQSGKGLDGLNLFEQFVNKEEGMRPCNICFTAVLTACNHAGLLDKAKYYFDEMGRTYGLVPELDQYACMVDLYGRTGHLRMAKELMERMPFEPNAVMWTSFLSSCRTYGEVELGREAANQLFKIDPDCVAHYVALANIYAEAGMWGEVLQVRKMMREMGFRKTAGWSWIEVQNSVHVFLVRDTSHHQSQDIYAELDKLTLEMMEGWVYHEYYDAETN